MRHDEEEYEGVCLSTSSDKRPRLENCLHSWPLEEGKNGNKERRTVGLGLVRTSYNCWVSETVVKNFTPTKAEVVHFRVKSRERGELDKKTHWFRYRDQAAGKEGGRQTPQQRKLCGNCLSTPSGDSGTIKLSRE